MTDKRGYQPDFYASFAPIRERDKRVNRANKVKWALLQHVPEPLSRFRCLDIGCSAGVMTAELADLFDSITGVDYDRTGLMAIQPQDKLNVSFVRADALHSAFASDSVDVVICAQVYEHVPNDVELVKEIYRILRPGGYCFFSGPNWLFPIELHYSLPFLHWLPESWADRYLRLTRQGTHYYERARTIWGLRQLLNGFQVRDISLDVLLHFYLAEPKGRAGLLKLVPYFIWKFAVPLFPNFNLILRKPCYEKSY